MAFWSGFMRETYASSVTSGAAAPGASEFSAVELNRSSPIAARMTAPVPGVWFENGPAFEITDPSRAVAVVSYPASGDPLLSGWLLGGARLNGKAALVDVTVGKGHAVLYGFRPQYRGLREKLYGGPREARLTQPALDVLSLVAYRQPVAKAVT